MCIILQYPNLKTNLNLTKGKCPGYRSGARVLGLVVAGCLAWLGWWLVVLVVVQGIKYWVSFRIATCLRLCMSERLAVCEA